MTTDQNSALVGVAFRKAWATELLKTKSRTSMKRLASSLVFMAFSFSVCLATFLSSYAPDLLPGWVENIATGLRWVLTLFLPVIICLSIVGLVFVGMAMAMLGGFFRRKESENADPLFRKLQMSIAEQINGPSVWNYFQKAFSILQILLLFGGGAMTLPIVWSLGIVASTIATYVYRQSVAEVIQNIITPANMDWLSKVDYIKNLELPALPPPEKEKV